MTHRLGITSPYHVYASYVPCILRIEVVACVQSCSPKALSKPWQTLSDILADLPVFHFEQSGQLKHTVNTCCIMPKYVAQVAVLCTQQEMIRTGLLVITLQAISITSSLGQVVTQNTENRDSYLTSLVQVHGTYSTV